eukprot:gene9357-12607_t
MAFHKFENIKVTDIAPSLGTITSLLYDFYNSTHGNYWKWDTDTSKNGEQWNFFTGNTNPCSQHWQGITCGVCTFSSCEIIKLELVSYNLSGTIPSSLSSINTLQSLKLDGNNLYSTIPTSINQLTALTYLSLSFNELTGNIPILQPCSELTKVILNNNHLDGRISEETFSDLTLLTDLFLYNNMLSNSLPESLYSLTSLNNLIIYNNYFTSSISTSIGNLIHLTSLYLNKNYLTSSIPSTISSLKSLQRFGLYDNKLSGTIPSELGQLSSLTYCNLSSNLFVGTIPEELSLLINLNNLELYDNYLTGTIPSSLFEGCISLNYLYLQDNLFTNSIPSSISQMKSLFFINLSTNSFSSTIPSSIGTLSNLTYIDLSLNEFTGLLPSTFSQLENLQMLFIQNNYLTGPVADFVISKKQQKITNLDLSNNLFSGTIPSEPFKIKSLLTFAAVGNCIDGSIPSDICASHSLTALVLDGIHTASTCQQLFFPKFKYDASYSIVSAVRGEIPSCLYNMTSLTTLHLSGNGLQGTIPNNLIISPKLTNLVLSHNELRGPIPLEIQTRPWNKLDLSYNKFTGTLTSKYATPTNNNESSLFLQVNRLSGIIPTSILLLQQISILDGNIFKCTYTSPKLPYFDSQTSTYQCGSNSFDLSVYMWLTIFVITAGIMVSILIITYKQLKILPAYEHLVYKIKMKMLKLQEWMNIFDNDILLYNGNNLEDNINNSSNNDDNYNNNEQNNNYKPPQIDTNQNDQNTTPTTIPSNNNHETSPTSAIQLYQIHIVNIHMFGMNISYVLITVNNDLSAIIIAEISLALFKIFWGEIIISAVLYHMKNNYIDSILLAQNRESMKKFELNNNHDSESGGNNFTIVSNANDDNNNNNNNNNKSNNNSNNSSNKSTILSAGKSQFIISTHFIPNKQQQLNSIYPKSTSNDYNTHNSLYHKSRNNNNSMSMKGMIHNIISNNPTHDNYHDNHILDNQNNSSSSFSIRPSFNNRYLSQFQAQNPLHVPLNQSIIVNNNDYDNIEATNTIKNYLKPYEAPNLIQSDFSVSLSPPYHQNSYNNNNHNINNNNIHNSINNNNNNNNELTSMFQPNTPLVILPRDSTTHSFLPRLEVEDIIFRVFINLFNYIATPFLATASISHNCFYNVFTPPPVIQVSYQFQGCQSFPYLISQITSCIPYITSHITYFVPPFLYSYQCSFTLITSYAAIYVFMFLAISFLQPIFFTWLKYLHTKTLPNKRKPLYLQNQSSKKLNYYRIIIDLFLPTILQPLSSKINVIQTITSENGSVFAIATPPPIEDRMNNSFLIKNNLNDNNKNNINNNNNNNNNKNNNNNNKNNNNNNNNNNASQFLNSNFMHNIDDMDEQIENNANNNDDDLRDYHDGFRGSNILDM